MFAVGRYVAVAGIAAGLLACATSPTGRSQLIMFPESEMAAMGVAAYDKLKTELPTSRVSTQYATQTGLELAGTIAGASTPASQQLMGLLGVGAQVGVILPFSRAQESEADALGLELMARAGFDPRQSVTLWENMEAAGGQAPPELLSTHPSSATRIEKLGSSVPAQLPVYEGARAAGKRPACR